jgi:hypothetical protein
VSEKALLKRNRSTEIKPLLIKKYNYSNTVVYVDMGPLLHTSLSPVFQFIFRLGIGVSIYYVPWTPLRYYNYWSLLIITTEVLYLEG